MQFSLASKHFIHFLSKYSPRHSVHFISIGQNYSSAYFKISVRTSQKPYGACIIRLSLLMLLREIAVTDVYCRITINTNVIFGQNKAFFNVKLRGTYSYRRDFKSWKKSINIYRQIQRMYMFLHCKCVAFMDWRIIASEFNQNRLMPLAFTSLNCNEGKTKDCSYLLWELWDIRRW
jgi:hypothetical protein